MSGPQDSVGAVLEHCPETRNRVRLALAAWAYEVHNDPLMPDDMFDRIALAIDVRKSTARPDLDEWFREHFNPHTGMWVLKHPEREKIEAIYQQIRGGTPTLSIWEQFVICVLG